MLVMVTKYNSSKEGNRQKSRGCIRSAPVTQAIILFSGLGVGVGWGRGKQDGMANHSTRPLCMGGGGGGGGGGLKKKDSLLLFWWRSLSITACLFLVTAVATTLPLSPLLLHQHLHQSVRVHQTHLACYSVVCTRLWGVHVCVHFSAVPMCLCGQQQHQQMTIQQYQIHLACDSVVHFACGSVVCTHLCSECARTHLCGECM